MWPLDLIDIVVEEVDPPVVHARIATPVGTLDLIGNIRIVGRILIMDQVHIDGLSAGSLGRAGLNALGEKIRIEADVDEIIVQGGVRTTGRNPGRAPKVLRYPRRRRA